MGIEGKVQAFITNLQNVVTHLEYDNVLHPEILLHPLHTLCPPYIFEGVVILSIEPVHDIPLKVFQEVHLALQLIRVHLYCVGLAHIHRSLPARSDVIKVPAKGEVSDSTFGEGTMAESRTVYRGSGQGWCCR